MSSRSRSRSTLRARSSDRGSKLVKPMPSSRIASPAGTNKRVAKLNLYLQRSAKSSVENLHKVADPISIPPRTSDVKRWEGNRRVTTKWDFVRRVSLVSCTQKFEYVSQANAYLQDPELWFPSGDCLIHFYERGQSRRGASLRIVFSDIESSSCGPLLAEFLPNFAPESPSSSSSDSDKFSDTVGAFNDPSPPARCEIYIPAPAHLSREDAFRYHLTTRNFFAWMYEKPLVGDQLSDALISLHRRLDKWRDDRDQNLDDILAYIDSGGYTDFRDCPDHALAVLQYAENYEQRELWTDAFVHCTGMWEQLDTSAEFEVNQFVLCDRFEPLTLLRSVYREQAKLSFRVHTWKWIYAWSVQVHPLATSWRMTSLARILAWGEKLNNILNGSDPSCTVSMLASMATGPQPRWTKAAAHCRSPSTVQCISNSAICTNTSSIPALARPSKTTSP